MRPRRATATLAAVGEFPFLARVLAQLKSAGRDLILGPGDDCAVVRVGGKRTLLTIDALVEGVHFESGWLSPRQIGAKAFTVNASDIAAMGGVPRWALVAFSAPGSYRAADLNAVERGIVAAAKQTGAIVVGGNLTRGDRLTVTITLIGVAGPFLTRSGARPGDAIYVTGTLGDSALGVRMLAREIPSQAVVVRRFTQPQARLRVGQLLARRGIASAAIDVSDGLLQDLAHVCEASGVGARLESRALPLSRSYRRICRDDLRAVLSGGEDYELLFTVPTRKAKQLHRQRAHFDCPITRIGTVVRGTGIALDGETVESSGRGFDHFRGAGLKT